MSYISYFSDEQFYAHFMHIYSDITQNMKAPWFTDGIPNRGIAYNPKTGVIFKGVNSLILEMRSAQKGYKDSRWLSYDEIDRLGIKIKYGESPTPIAYINKYSPPTNVNPITGNRFNGENPRRHYYFLYNVEQLKNYELAHDNEFIVGKEIVIAKIKNAIANSHTNNLQDIQAKLIEDTVRTVPENMTILAQAITSYRLAQEFHVPYKPVITGEQKKELKKQYIKQDKLLRTMYQAEVIKDKLLTKNMELESGLTRSVVKTHEMQHPYSM